MNKIICDVCKINEANKRFKVKVSEKRWNNLSWTAYETIDICVDCGEKYWD